MIEPPAERYSDVNVKAHCRAPEAAEQKLLEAGAHYVGEDHQIDTFYQIDIGKLKVREGQIESLVTHYQRLTVGDEWHTRVWLYERNPDQSRIDEIIKGRKILGKISKRRKIFFIGNVKFHLDTMTDGKCFVEIEAMDKNGELGISHLSEQARLYQQLLGIQEQDRLKSSYIDLNLD